MAEEQQRTTHLTRDEAWVLLTRYNKDAFHLHHAETVERSAKDLNLKSVKKKFKDKKFAAGCSRDVIRRGAEQLGWSLDELIERTISAVQSFSP